VVDSPQVLHLPIRQQEGHAMKSLVALFVLCGAMLLCGTGCFATPAYSGHERAQMIGRNWGYEGKMISDDIDTLLLLRPSTRLTIWHVR
jgi:hypothetical protein